MPVAGTFPSVASALSAQAEALEAVEEMRRETRCPSCGSGQTVLHQGKSVCAYCRSER